MIKNELENLVQVMKELRDPAVGCEWDKRQTFESIVPYTIEEAYEVADAIDNKDYVALKEELGDLLLQVVFHSQMAEEIIEFNINDVINTVISKLRNRHPNIYNTKEVENLSDLETNWEKIKAREREVKALSQGKDISVLDNIPNNLPSIIRAEKLQKRAATIGFDWDDIDLVFAKVLEEIEELKDEINAANDSERILDESGDLLFACVNVLRHLNINPEVALRAANHKFERRFRILESLLGSNGTQKNIHPQELNILWEKAKTIIRQSHDTNESQN